MSSDDERTPSEALTAFLAKCDAEHERVRLEVLAAAGTIKEAHLRHLVAVLSIEAALDAKRQAMRYVPADVDPADVVPHFGRVLGRIESHKKMVAKFTALAEEGEVERNRGREIARRNAQVGVERAEHAIVTELDRHIVALGRLTAPEAIDAEQARHDRKLAELNLKAEGALAALEAVT